jgi:hypothetical protein
VIDRATVENEMGAVQRVHITKVFANCLECPSRSLLSSEIDPAEIIGSFDMSSLKREARRLLGKSTRPHPVRAL